MSLRSSLRCLKTCQHMHGQRQKYAAAAATFVTSTTSTTPTNHRQPQYLRNCSSFRRIRNSLCGETGPGLRTFCSIRKQDEEHSSAVANVEQLHDKQMLQVEWSSGKCSQYPWLWLRDNCQCKECFHPVSLSRTFYLKDLDLDIKPLHTEVLTGSAVVQIKWSDGHQSTHNSAWLQPRAFESEQRRNRDIIHKLSRKPWPEVLPAVSWQALMNDDVALLSWLVLLETYGLVLVNDAPMETGHVRKLAERVAFVKRTHYGHEFHVIAKPDPSNVAYSNATLALHLDLPYYLYKPGVQLIHCVRQHLGTGGDSQISDSLFVAKQLREQRPDLFNLLADTPVDWIDEAMEDGRQYFKTLKMPVICLDKDGGNIWRINLSQPQRDSFFTECRLEDVKRWYEALKTFHNMLYDPSNCRTFKMKPGSMITIDNLRSVHGRTGYPADEGPINRHIEGCYIDWDEVRSRRRVLAAKHGMPSTL